jgi:GNAT superfamily N-acetyltransferase
MNIDIVQGGATPRGLIQLIESTTFGTDGLRYQRLNVKDQLSRLNDPEYFSAWKDDTLVGSYIVDRRTLTLDNKPCQGFYRGALAVAEPWQGRGVATALTQRAIEWQKTCNTPSLSYGFIDNTNTRSLAVLDKHGTVCAGRLSMYMIYRQWPKPRCELVELDALNDLDKSEQLVNDQARPTDPRQQISMHANCIVQDITPGKQPALALIHQGKAIISAQVSRTAFKINSMGKFASWATKLCVSPWPPARRRFDPENFQYVSLANLTILPGYESCWSDFVSSVMAEHNVHFAVVYLDTRANTLKRLRESQPFGKLLHSSRGNIKIVARYSDCATPPTRPDQAWHVWPIDA